MKVSFFRLQLLVLLVIVASGCNQSAFDLPVVSMRIGSQTFNIEVASTPDTREKGLMERDSMPDDHGMIFIFTEELPRSFWMHHTRFPLDIIFLNSAGVVVSIKQMKPYDEHETPSDKPHKYAIELNKGAVESSGVKVGDRINIPTGMTAK